MEDTEQLLAVANDFELQEERGEIFDAAFRIERQHVADLGAEHGQADATPRRGAALPRITISQHLAWSSECSEKICMP